MAKKIRIDMLLVETGHAASRDRAQRLIRAGQVLVADSVVDKPGTKVDPNLPLRLRGQDHPYVSRGGVKLQGALEDFALDVTGLTCLDVGASTGGFTDCLVQRGADHVLAVDVGTNQLAWKLRSHPQVTSLEKTDIRVLTAEALDVLGGAPELVVIDASFISLRLVLPPVVRLLGPQSRVLALVKPQFEVGKGQVGRGGLVDDDNLRAKALGDVRRCAEGLGLQVLGTHDSQLAGARSGNREIFILVSVRPGC
jgi:23S rRNA (cytidine1920-2'-O)/16S rRNA (cytidine1409-2'-O)-methyltransferase